MFEFFANVWNSGAGNKIMLIAAAIVFVGAIVGVIYAIVNRYTGGTSSGDEAFLRTPNQSIYHWDKKRFPVMASFDPMLPERYKEVYKAIAVQINYIVGRVILDEIGTTWAISKGLLSVDEVPSGMIYIFARDIAEGHRGGATEIKTNNKTGEIYSCYIEVSQGLTEAQIETAMRHEIGHALGLGHDLISESVMYDSTGDTVKGFTEQDKKRLAELYG